MARFRGSSAIRPWLVAIAAAVSWAFTIEAAHAVDGITLELEGAAGAGWSAAAIVVELELQPAGLRATATIAAFSVGDSGAVARDVKLVCGELELSGNEITCLNAQVAGLLPEIGPQQAAGRIRYDRATGDLDVALGGLSLASGRADLDLALRDSGWSARAVIRDADAVALAAWVGRFSDALPVAPQSGSLDLNLNARGTATTLATLDFTATTNALNVGNDAGTLATDGLEAQVQGSVRRESEDWRFDGAVAAPAGQAYFEPVFIDFAAGELRAEFAGRYSADGRVAFERFAIDHRDALSAAGSAALKPGDTWSIEMLDVRIDELRLPGAFTTYLAPFVLDSPFANLATRGQLRGGLSIVEGLPSSFDLYIDSVTADDGAGTIAVSDLSGEVHWTAPESEADVEAEESVLATPAVSALSWSGGSLFGLTLGASELRFTTRGRGLRLIEETTIPVLDGAVDLEAFRIRNLGRENVAFLIGAEIRPISVAQLCRAFGWPEFGGTLAGSIRKLRMRDGVVSLGTTLAAQVFDGEIRLGDLRLERPFDDWPRLYANIELERLDLEQVTAAFSFGRITGRLGGRVSGLELFNWMPVAFDAELATPPGDRSKHRISQRAVQNIGSLGGSGAGVTAALSSGFLRFFEDFNYARLGISCRLRNEVCEMGGVAPAEGDGYYLVKGRGVPRIDVIGNRKRVDWPRLVHQLIAITEAEGPVVQ